jgi:hypothetical protein
MDAATEWHRLAIDEPGPSDGTDRRRTVPPTVVRLSGRQSLMWRNLQLEEACRVETEYLGALLVR